MPIDGAMTIGALRTAIERLYSTALDTDFSDPAAQARFWYVSEEKLEPRLGERATEHGAEREQPLAVARDVARMHRSLAAHPRNTKVADFLSAEPEHRHTVRRVQITARRPYAEIRDNLISATMRPIDILRCKLSFFGATDFDPRSDRWVRISMFKHAPLLNELSAATADDWAIPPLTHADAAAPACALQAWSPADDSELHVGFSLGEIEAQAKKAARGAGLPWGLAEEAGRIARALASNAPRLLATMADDLEALYDGRHAWRLDVSSNTLRSYNTRPVSALVLAPAIADRISLMQNGATLSIEASVAAPELLAPILAGVAARCGSMVLIGIDGRTIEAGIDRANATQMLARISEKTGAISVSLSHRLAPSPTPTHSAAAGVPLPAELWQRFDALAALTYVPASEESRLSGAGAGLSDND